MGRFVNTRTLPLLATVVVFVLIYAICAAQYPAMLGLRVMGNLLTDNAFLGILAVGMTVVVVAGGIDLSVGAVMGLTTVALARLIEGTGLPPALAFALVLALGGMFGAGVGAAIHYLKAPAFIVTLTAMFLARGCALLISTDSIPIHNAAYDTLAAAALALPGGGRLTLVAGIMLLTFLAGGILLHGTRFGARVFALGGNGHFAQLMGINTGRTTILVHAFCSLMAALAGIVFSLYTRSGYALTGTGVELDAIAAVVIGGTLLTGGVGGVAGSFIGVLIQGLILTWITFDGTLSSWWTKIAIGALLFLFIAVQRLILVASARYGRSGAGPAAPSTPNQATSAPASRPSSGAAAPSAS
ncbi:galactofuranose ABC transporter, permease protein YjfF [Nitrospirillum bahiense]|uniref:Monosaccharide ABC transporter membrane protein (CUT2 family) n=1 Tax=Nitrospirillum amazonense TaxID=28077 RepID=A0A560GDZ1_9PROT|nr:galactofuranose ABC transporter, permease protein YjfF [Nitrospirillum amazonense]TWB32021.1 monosaccharide ABC transporter membrane protein (CUT2 family) [Nitrospirillum amazonense]